MLWQFHCSWCGASIGAVRSPGRNRFEKYILPLLLMQPVRCVTCGNRQYRLVFGLSSATRIRVAFAADELEKSEFQGMPQKTFDNNAALASGKYSVYRMSRPPNFGQFL